MSTRIAHNKTSIETVKEWCNTRNIEFMDPHYISNKYKHTWFCKKHLFSHVAMWGKIKERGMLKCCSKEQLELFRFMTVTDTESRCNITLVGQYKGLSVETAWRCNIHNEIFYNTKQILDHTRGKPPCCRGGLHGHTLDYIQQYAISRNAVFLDKKYIGTLYKHNWLCNVHNQTNLTSFSIFGRGSLLSCCNVEAKSGKNNSRYNINVSDEDRIYDRRSAINKTWRQQVIKRDNCTCVRCASHISEQKIVAHHIFSYLSNPTLRHNPNNGITLCVPCHNAFHSKYGKINNTFFQLIEFCNIQ